MHEFELTMTSLMSVALGGVGCYLLLPRGANSADRFGRIVGGILATISLVLLASQFGKAIPGNATNELTFYVLAAVSIGSAVLMIASHNPVLSALWFAMVLLSNSGLYLLQGAEFLSAATIIIYAGAIIVTFLFVIMLAQPQGAAPYDLHSREPLLSCTAGVILAWTLLGTLSHAATSETTPIASRTPGSASNALPSAELIARASNAQPDSVVHPENGHVNDLGRALFLEHYVSVEIIGMLLLVAVVGAVLIANRNIESKLDGKMTNV